MAGPGDGPRVINGPPLAGHGAEEVRDAIAAKIATPACPFAFDADVGPGQREGPENLGASVRQTGSSDLSVG